MAAPIVKLKRGNNQVPSGLSPGELAVDLGTNRLYVGNNSGVSVPINAEVSGVTFLGSSDNKTPTQKAVKTYVDNKQVVGSSKPYLIAKLEFGEQMNTNVQLQELSLQTLVVESQTSNINLLFYEPDDQSGLFYNGFYQTQKDFVYLQVNYFAHIPPVDNSSILGEIQNFGFWRSMGLRLINLSTGESHLYGMKLTPPVIGADQFSQFGQSTRLNGSAMIQLPRYTEQNKWKLQLVYHARFNAFVGPEIGDVEEPYELNGQNNVPEIALYHGIRIEIVKIAETST